MRRLALGLVAAAVLLSFAVHPGGPAIAVTGTPTLASPSPMPAPCVGAEAWWDATRPRLVTMVDSADAMYSLMLEAVRFKDADRMGPQQIARGQQARTLAETFDQLAEDQHAMTPPPIAEDVNDEIVAILDTFAYSMSTAAAVLSGTINPMAREGTALASERSWLDAARAVADTSPKIDRILFECFGIPLPNSTPTPTAVGCRETIGGDCR